MRFVCDFFGQVLQPNCSAFTLFSRLSCDTCQSNIVFIFYYQVAFFFLFPKIIVCCVFWSVAHTHTHDYKHETICCLYIWMTLNSYQAFLLSVLILKVAQFSLIYQVTCCSNDWLDFIFIVCCFWPTFIGDPLTICNPNIE